MSLSKNYLFQSFFMYWNQEWFYIYCVKSDQIRSFFWSVFSSTRTEYGQIRSISPYSVRIRENTDQKKLRIWTLFTQWYFEIEVMLWVPWQKLQVVLFSKSQIARTKSNFNKNIFKINCLNVVYIRNKC